MKLKHRVALITGGSRGLGKAIAIAMANEGAKVVICGIDRQGLTSAAKEIEKLGAECVGILCDVSSSQTVQQMFEEIKRRFGALHILVNNAALTPSKPIDENRRNRFYALLSTPIPRQSLGITKTMSDEEWLKFWGVNVHGVFYCTREALKLMEEQHYGRIINIASTAGISCDSAHSPHYSATKGAVVAFTKSVGMEVAGANIYVNCIAAGGIMTSAFESYLARATDQERNRFYQLIPAGRLGDLEEYASLAVYLASDEHYLVGQVISPNGGVVI